MSSALTLDVCLIAYQGISKEFIVKNYLNLLLKDEYKVTIKVDAPTATVEKRVKLQFWIFTKEFDWQSFVSKQIVKSKAILIIYDITNSETLKWAYEKIQSIKNILDYIPPILLLGNNIEVEKNREISKEQIKDFITANEIDSTMDISLKTGKNIEKTFMELTEIMLKSNSYDYMIDVKRITPFKGYKHLGILIAVIIYITSVIASLIAYIVFLVF
ncbi:MAG: hypothetical protein ACFFE4_06350 [Candidatus Thorarchaeota archaeon]